jgi:hypothetical protein
MRKPISPYRHGVLDYATVAALALISRRRGVPPATRRLSALLAGGYGSLAMVTDYPLGLWRLVPFRAHDAVELAAAAVLPFVSRALPRRDRRAALGVCAGLMALTLAVAALTEWNTSESQMTHEHRATYLNDHLAGAAALLDLLAQLERAHARTDVADTLAELRADIVSDRQELERLMKRLHIAKHRSRKAVARIAERGTRLKLWVDAPADGALRLLEALDAVALGIEGKLALWRALDTAAEDVPDLRMLDYERLEKRARAQRRRVEELRLVAARAALGGARDTSSGAHAKR